MAPKRKSIAIKGKSTIPTPRSSKRRQSKPGVSYKVDSDSITTPTALYHNSSSNDSSLEITKVNTTAIDNSWFKSDEHKKNWSNFHNRDICSSDFLEIDFFKN